MIAKIRSLDPTGVEVEAEEFILPVVVEYTLEEGFKEEIQPNGTVITYEPARQFRYFLDIGDFIYKLNARTGELTFICKTDQV